MLCKNARKVGRSGPCCKQHPAAARIRDVQLDGWRRPDVIHIKNNGRKNALISANLSWARHEKSLTSSFKRGAFEGAAEAAATYFDTCDFTDDLCGVAYPLIVFQLCQGRFGPSCGTAEHMQEIFQKARPCFRKAGSAVKPGRDI